MPYFPEPGKLASEMELWADLRFEQGGAVQVIVERVAYAAPGRPERAAELAWRDAFLAHRRTGIYGAMYFAASISAAFVTGDPIEALKVGLTEIPRKCRRAKHLAWAVAAGSVLRDWRDGRKAVDERFAGMHPVHTVNDACSTVFGLYLGRGDFTRTTGVAAAMGPGATTVLRRRGLFSARPLENGRSERPGTSRSGTAPART